LVLSSMSAAGGDAVRRKITARSQIECSDRAYGSHSRKPSEIQIFHRLKSLFNRHNNSDCRFIETFGIARLLDYMGFDLCDKNVHNARQMFSRARFEVGNVLEIDADDKTFDYCFVHDLFEHLSIEATEAAISELCRVTRRDICAGFFNMHAGGEHIVKAVGDYHWNALSVPRTKAFFERYASKIQIIHIDEFLTSKFGCEDAHNKGAYTFVVSL